MAGDVDEADDEAAAPVADEPPAAISRADCLTKGRSDEIVALFT